MINKVLSLFDGISGVQVSLNKLNINPPVYLSSEINQKAIQITQKNFPNTVQLGDINSLKIDYRDIDLLVFGSPCVDLSIGKKNRQSLKGKSSGLFYKAVEILNFVKPRFFLMENVASMTQESKDEISRLLGVSPVSINSRDFTFQNRERLYWCNWIIPPITNPKMGGFKDLLLTADLNSLLLSEKGIAYMNRPVKDGRTHWEFGHHSETDKKYSSCVVSNFKKGVPYNVLVDKRNERNVIRKFHPIEVERLQGFPDDFTEGVSWTHRYECLGNAFNVDTLIHILRGII